MVQPCRCQSPPSSFITSIMDDAVRGSTPIQDQIFVMWSGFITYFHRHGHEDKFPWEGKNEYGVPCLELARKREGVGPEEKLVAR
ncbi:hypothetical protein E2562_037010 [Oryza meyeriana var. granulata]|uniref:Uncharacterized protein n=1 Tax=Oryza meyeriana var. granulata TaxID=110450 RepID=A0A6G1CXF0_9ORYZ|nr:hypothetical protein E2562_037010 [Oryza meyeriana var. granulata]